MLHFNKFDHYLMNKRVKCQWASFHSLYLFGMHMHIASDPFIPYSLRQCIRFGLEEKSHFIPWLLPNLIHKLLFFFFLLLSMMYSMNNH